MRYVALIVGIAMVLAGLTGVIAGIAQIVRFMASIGASSFECAGSGCDFLGDAPLLIGGGIVLLVLGIFVASLASAAVAFQRGTDPSRWTKLGGLGQLNRFSQVNRLSPPRASIPVTSTGSMIGPQGVTNWNVTTDIAQMLPHEIAPLISQMLQSLSASGHIGQGASQVQVIDSVTGRPIQATTAPDGRTPAERDRDIRATGTLGQATVESFRELPAAAGDARLYELYLEVKPEDRAAYKVRHFELVPARWAYRVAMGASFQVWVDHDDPSRLLIEWERS